MTALAMQQDFAIIPATEWLVLRCASGRTMALAAALADYGAWTPTWKVSKQLPNGSRRMVTEPCMSGIVFIPDEMRFDLPHVPRIHYWLMKEFDGRLSRVPDWQLNDVRKIADRPLPKASELPKVGSIVMMPAATGAWQGLRAKVLACTQRKATVAVEIQGRGFSQEIQLAPCLLLKIQAEPQSVRRAMRHRNRRLTT
jgi:hypothetical protein